jgi:alpha-1,6-mannosyltransferase
MKICDVTQFYSPVSGGVKRYLLEKIDYLRQFTDHEHVLIVPGAANETERDGRFTVHRVRALKVSLSSHYRMVLDAQTVEHLIEQERPDLIEAGCPYQLAWSSLRVGQRIFSRKLRPDGHALSRKRGRRCLRQHLLRLHPQALQSVLRHVRLLAQA